MTEKRIRQAISVLRANIGAGDPTPEAIDAVFFLLENALLNLQELADESRAARYELENRLPG